MLQSASCAYSMVYEKNFKSRLLITFVEIFFRMDVERAAEQQQQQRGIGKK